MQKISHTTQFAPGKSLQLLYAVPSVGISYNILECINVLLVYVQRDRPWDRQRLQSLVLASKRTDSNCILQSSFKGNKQSNSPFLLCHKWKMNIIHSNCFLFSSSNVNVYEIHCMYVYCIRYCFLTIYCWYILQREWERTDNIYSITSVYYVSVWRRTVLDSLTSTVMLIYQLRTVLTY